MIFHPNMSLRETRKEAEKLGCTVKVKDGEGELVFTHPKIDKPFATSINKESIGKAFLSWIKPLTNNKPSLYEGSFQWTVAKAIAFKGQDGSKVSVDDILEYFKYHGLKKAGRKSISDAMAHLNRKKLITRIDYGIYVPSDYLLDFFYPKQQKEQEFEPETTTETTTEPTTEPTTELEPSKEDRLLSAVNKMEEIVSRFEKAVERLEVSEEARDLMGLIKEFAAKSDKIK
jgi:hypothetical protein